MDHSTTPKICVYAICKNEIKFLMRWLLPLQEANDIVILDTGSTDGTYEELKELQKKGLITRVEQKIIEPWRFDTARNESMKLIPEDAEICVVSDCDQVFRKGWAYELRLQYLNGYDEIYGDIIDYNDNGEEIKRFLSKNVHPNRKEWYWERPVHEGVSYHGDGEYKSYISDSFVIEHHPDRSKSRDQYLDILEREYNSYDVVTDPMCAIYYGCELSFHGRNDECLDVFLKAMINCDFTDHPECGYQIALNIADEYKTRGMYELGLEYAYKACNYGIITRRLYMSIAFLYLELEDDDKFIEFVKRALGVKYQDKSWIESECYFSPEPYVLIANAYGRKQDYKSEYAYYLLAKEEYDNIGEDNFAMYTTIKSGIRSSLKMYINEGNEEENGKY